jgi:translation elongation factor EF-G
MVTIENINKEQLQKTLNGIEQFGTLAINSIANLTGLTEEEVKGIITYLNANNIIIQTKEGISQLIINLRNNKIPTMKKLQLLSESTLFKKQNINESVLAPLVSKYAPKADYDNAAKEARKAIKEFKLDEMWKELVELNKGRDKLAKEIHKAMADGADNAKLNEMHAKDTVVNALCNVLIMAIPSAAKKENKTGYKNRDEIKEKLKSAGIMYSTHNSKELEEAGFYK